MGVRRFNCLKFLVISVATLVSTILPIPFFLTKKFMCIAVLSVCLSVHHMHAWYNQRPEESIRSMELELQEAMSHYVGAWH